MGPVYLLSATPYVVTCDVPGTEDRPGVVPVHHPAPHLRHAAQLSMLKVPQQRVANDWDRFVGDLSVSRCYRSTGNCSHCLVLSQHLNLDT